MFRSSSTLYHLSLIPCASPVLHTRSLPQLLSYSHTVSQKGSSAAINRSFSIITITPYRHAVAGIFSVYYTEIRRVLQQPQQEKARPFGRAFSVSINPTPVIPNQ